MTVEAVAHLIKVTQYRQHRALDVALGAIGVSLVQWNALREIDLHPGASMHTLAEATFNSDQSFGALVVRLLRAGWIERRAGKGRALVHELTASGSSIYQRGAAIYRATIQESFAGISDRDLNSLHRILINLQI